MTRQPERNETNAARQARLRERRKAQGFKRVSVWLSPDQVDRMERQGGEPWLGRIVKQLLESAVVEPARPQWQSRLRCSQSPILKRATVADLNRNQRGLNLGKADSLSVARRRCSRT